MQYIKDNNILEDGWVLVSAPDETPINPAEDVIVPYKYWLAHKEQLTTHQGKLSIFLEGDDPVEDLQEHLDQFDMLGVAFPMFKDGRCYTHARLLRERYGYKGELRALGEVLRDQLFYMKRCGIDAFALQEGSDYQAALASLNDFTHVYQAAADGATPIPRLR